MPPSVTLPWLIRPILLRPKNFFRWSSQIRQPGRVRSYEPRGSGMNFCVQQFEALVGCGGIRAMAIYRGSRRLSSPRSSHRQKIPWRERREFSRSRRTSVSALIPVSLSRANAVQDFFDVCERNPLKSCLSIATSRQEFLPVAIMLHACDRVDTQRCGRAARPLCTTIPRSGMNQSRPTGGQSSQLRPLGGRQAGQARGSGSPAGPQVNSPVFPANFCRTD